MNLRILLLAVLLTPSLATAAPLIWAGHLEDQNGPVNTNVSLNFRVNRGPLLVIEVTEASLEVVDGDFVVELEIPAGFDGLTQTIIINGNDFGEEPLGVEWPIAAAADLADLADVALTTDDINGVVPIADGDLAAGSVPVAFANVTGFPADFADGDQGIDFAPTARFSFVGNTIALADGGLQTSQLSGVLATADFASGAIGTADIADATITNADFGSIPVAAIANATLNASHFSAAQNRTTLFTITNTFCANRNQLTAATTCPAIDDCPLGAERRDCNGTCGNIVNANCLNTPVGDLVFR